MKNIVEFILETGVLKRTPRSGWALLGIDRAESVADHSHRTAVIGYLLAHLEKADPYKVLLMTLFNDSHEARTTDLHKMAQRYVDAHKAEDTAFDDQIADLPNDMRNELTAMRADFREQESKESIVARDCDILEFLIQAKEYHEHGHKGAALFMKKAPKHLATDSAKKLWDLAKDIDVHDWWTRVSTFER